MQIIREREAVSAIADAAIRQMILQRIDAIASDEPLDANLHGYFLVVESGDTLQAINKHVGFDLLAKPYEILEEYSDCYDLLYVVSDDGYSHLSFRDDAFASICAENYHLLRDFMMEHSEATAILRAID
jgi:hypothetical protein